MKEKIEQLYIQALLDDLAPNVFAEKVLELLHVRGMSLKSARVGDYLKCTSVFAQSKRYTVGEVYPILEIQMMPDVFGFKEEPYLVIRDNRNHLVRINQNRGISYTSFEVLSLHK